MTIIIYLSTITLNVNGLRALVKRHRLAGWIRKQDTYPCCPQETRFMLKDTQRLIVKWWEKIFHENGNAKKLG